MCIYVQYILYIYANNLDTKINIYIDCRLWCSWIVKNYFSQISQCVVWITMQHFSLYSNLMLTSESATLKTASKHIIIPPWSRSLRKVHWRTLYLLFNLSLSVFYLLQYTPHSSVTCTHKHNVARACISLQLQVWNVETWFRYLMSCENNSPKMSQVIQHSDALSCLAA